MANRAFFDAHCDTAIKVLDEGAEFVGGSSSTHLDFPRLKAAGVRAQVFAAFNVTERYPGCEAERAETLIDTLDRMIAETAGEMRPAHTARVLREAFAGGPIAAVFGLEGADALEGRAENLRGFFARGIRDLVFAWKDNAFSGSAAGRNTPLTGEGERLLGLCEDLGVIVDVSHLSDAAFERVCDAATRPFIASHSDCRALCPSPRNLSDGMIRALADRGGVMGINLSTSFLSAKTREAWMAVRRRIESRASDWREGERLAKEIAPTIPRPPFETIVEHVLHALNVGGEDAVGLGGDLDGIFHLPEGIDGVEGYPRIADALAAAGLSDSQVDKVCSRNFLRIFEEILPD